MSKRAILSFEVPRRSRSATYDAVGNRKTIVTGTGTTNYAYDAADRLTSVTPPVGKPSLALTKRLRCQCPRSLESMAMTRRRREGPTFESVSAAITAERLQSRRQRALLASRRLQAEFDAAKAALRPSSRRAEMETSLEPDADVAKQDFGRAALKRIRVRDALLQVAAEGEAVSVAAVAARLGVSGYLVKRTLREHQIQLPPPVKVEPPHLGSIEARRESVRSELLQMDSEGQLTLFRRVAEILGISPPMVRRGMREQGLDQTDAPKPVLDQPKQRTESRRAVRVHLMRLIEDGKVTSQSDAARQLGVSRQRVHQILAKEGSDFARRVDRPSCRQCGRRLAHPNGRSASDGLCKMCRPPQRVVLTCPDCGAVREAPSSILKTMKSERCVTCSRRRAVRLAIAGAARARLERPRWWFLPTTQSRPRPRQRLALSCLKCGQEREVVRFRARYWRTGLCVSCFRTSRSQLDTYRNLHRQRVDALLAEVQAGPTIKA
jgi:YD repeat-containing protein